MSDAKVIFSRIDDATPAVWQEFTFKCPRGNGRCGPLVIAGTTKLPHDPNNKNGGIAQWRYDGNFTAPTFSPSINCKACWHGYIRKGRCVDAKGNEEPDARSS